MNKFINAELNKITLPIINIENNKFIIKKQIGCSQNQFAVGEIYNIKVEDYILNPPPSFTLAENWNFGTNPPEKELSAKVLQIVGKMIKFNCIGKTTGITWEGWLPNKSIQIL